MNKQTKFQIKLIAKKNALESIIEDTLNHINDKRYPSTRDFFITQKVRYEAKLETVNQIIEDYLSN
tara:strand:- start:581 stop:778 length:198 start_codon:yes stop_codon:yes gene_type:complete